MKSKTETALCPVAAIFLVMAVVPFAMAQGSASREPLRRECEGTEGLERKRCESGKELIREDTSSECLLFSAFESPRIQIGDDLKYLKAVASYLARASQVGELDLKAIATTTGEIRKRAERLRSRLSSTSSEPKDTIRELELPTDPAQLKLSIHRLSALIAGAVQNPALREQVLDAIGSAKARSDLDAIVEISERIRTQCELLDKSEP